MPDHIEFRTKPQIALDLVDRAGANGIRVKAWTFDEFYGRDGAFLDALEQRQQVFAAEVPANFYGWVGKPQVLEDGPSPRCGRKKNYPRLARRRPVSTVRNLFIYSPKFRQQKWQRYRVKDTDRGPAVWEVKWAVFWRKEGDGLPGRRHCLIVTRNVLTGEVKYFVSNRVPGDRGVTLRWLLRVAFGRWSVESCFRQAKEELGLDHYEVRGWRCVHRHFYLTQLSHLFCARIRQKFDAAATQEDPVEEIPTEPGRCGGTQTESGNKDVCQHLTTEQVRRAVNVWLSTLTLRLTVTQHLQRELDRQRYYQRRNVQARKSHTKRRLAELKSRGIDPDRIKTCISPPPT